MRNDSCRAIVVATTGSRTIGRVLKGLRNTVNTLSDELNADGDCSLREAVQAANTNAAVDTCTAGAAGADLILLPAGTIPVAATIQINESVTIRGAGRASTTINGGGGTVFNSSAAGVVLTLEDMSVVGGANALNGAIAATRVDFSGGDTINTLGGAITLTDVTLSGGTNVNTSSGAVTMTSVTMSGGGGVNTSSAPITMTQSSITAANGTAVNTSTGAVTLVDSSVAGSVDYGINSGSGPVSLTRSLVSGSGEDGINVGGGTLAVVNSTISGNQGRGISGGVGSTVTLNAVTITGNTVAGLSSGAAAGTTAVHAILGPNGGPNCGAAVASSSFSIDSGITCALVRSITNPLLGALANNGGPTFTHLPQAGSPAIDNGSNGACHAVDQRGVARPVDGDGDSTATCDIGAVEAGAGSPPPPPPPPPASIETIPTLSEWGLMLLALLLGLVAAWRMRSSWS
jgi:CSLREA domain-containing protein